MTTSERRTRFGPPRLHRRQTLTGLCGSILAAGVPLGFLDPAPSLAAGDLPGPEKKSLIIGIHTTLCATPIIMAQHLGLFKKYGFDAITIIRTESPPLMAEQLRSGAFDLAQQFMPLPLLRAAASGPIDDFPVAVANLSSNGAALVLSLKSARAKDPKGWRGFRFGVPSLQSFHALMLRFLLAENGLDPDAGVTLKVVADSEVSAQLRAGLIDGNFGSEPASQMAVFEGLGYIHTLSRDIWPGHSNSVLAAYVGWIRTNPQTLSAAVSAIIEAAAYAAKPENAAAVAAVIARPDYLDFPEAVADQILSGPFADGLGKTAGAGSRVLFDPRVHIGSAIWMLTQMKRWGLLRGDVKYAETVRRAILGAGMRTLPEPRGIPAPISAAAASGPLMGPPFDSSQPEDYIALFRIRRR